MELSPRQRQALEEICDTFCPSEEGLPTARELGVADAVIAAVDANPREPERRQLMALLSGWDTPALGALQRHVTRAARARAAFMGRLAPGAAARRVSGAAQGGTVVLLRAARALR